MALKELVSGSRAELMDRLMKKRLRSLGVGVARSARCCGWASRVAVSNALMFIDPKDGLLVACRTSGSVSLGNMYVKPTWLRDIDSCDYPSKLNELVLNAVSSATKVGISQHQLDTSEHQNGRWRWAKELIGETPWKFNSSPLKNDAWKIILLLAPGIFWGANC